jgi:hypothetical protein
MGQLMQALKIIIKMFTFKSWTKANSIIIVNIWWMRKFWKGVFGISILRAPKLYIRCLKNIGDLWDQERVELISWKIIWKKCQFWRTREGVGRMYSWQLTSMLGRQVDEHEDANIKWRTFIENFKNDGSTYPSVIFCTMKPF